MTPAPKHGEQDRSRVVVALRRLVAQGTELPAERRLSEDLGANRYVVRQAIQTLRGEGLIAPQQRQRPALWRHDHVLQHTSPPELWEARLTFEPQITRLAALNATPQEMGLIADLHAQADPERFERALDIALHRAIANASHNRLAAFLVDRLTEITADTGFQTQQPPLTRETGWHHHEAIVAALVARRPAEAERVMSDHLRAITLWSRGLSSTGII